MDDFGKNKRFNETLWKNGYREKSDSTLKRMTKDELVSLIRCLENNWSAALERCDNQRILLGIKYGHDWVRIDEGNEDVLNALAKSLLDVSCLVGCVCERNEDDDVVIEAEHSDKYYLVGHISHLLKRGEMIVRVDERRYPHMLKLLHLNKKE